MARTALLVGAGSMGRTWAANLRDCPETEIAGIVDINPEAILGLLESQKINVPYRSAELARALDEVKPDFLVDVTVPEAHCDVTIAALDRGVPVLGEKPMASTMEEARRMVAKSQATSTLYMVSQSRRYNPSIQAYRRLIQRLGPLGILNADFYLGAHFGGFRDEMDSVLLLDMAIHTMDQARFLSGADPVSVYCEEFNPSWSWYKGASSANAIFEMTNGLRFTYRGSWCAEGRNTSWESEWRAVGPNGSGTWDGNRDVKGELAKPTGGFIREVEAIEEKIEEDPNQGVAGSLRDFLKALDAPTYTPFGRCEDNIKSLAMVFGAVESAKQGKRVGVEL